jgi:hypothetical protein
MMGATPTTETTVTTPRSKATAYIVAVTVLCILDALFVMGMTLIRPAMNNQPIILTVLGVTTPVIMALLGQALQQVNLAVDGRLTQLLALTASSERAKGELSGLLQPVPGTEVKTSLDSIHQTLREHDVWERDKAAALEAAHELGRAAGVEMERLRTEQKKP